jgi:glycosyltransferase involved in cell wall biosynthesis
MTQESDRPLVSVITPVLNRAKTIASSLASVASQTYPHIEHIVVDGGSTDETLEIVKSFDGPYTLRWISERDEGMYDAINKGLRMAEGDLLAYLNSDDLYVPWSVERVVTRLSEGVDLVYGDLGVLTVSSPPRFHLQFYPDFDLAHFTYVGALGQPTVFWRRSLTEEIGEFDSSYRLIGDCEYWLRAAASGARIEHVEEILAIQVEHPGTLRAAQSALLGEEFRRLRVDYSAHSQAPRSAFIQKLKKKALWLIKRESFRRDLKRNSPRRWGEFIEFLRARNIEPTPPPLAYMLLPPRFRPKRSTWADVQVIRDELIIKS